MIRIEAIQDALFQLVGWEQGFGANRIDAGLVQPSESGLTFQGAHPLVTLENIRQIMPTDFGAEAWDAAVQYFAGDAVLHGGKTWVALAANVGVTPGTDSEVWLDSLSWYVRKLTREGITSAVQTFIQQKQLSRETRSLLERRMFFDGAARLTSITTPTGKMVGFEIVPVRAMGVTMKIDRIGLQMTGATGTVRVYLFHSSKREPVRTLDLEITDAKGTFKWFPVNLELPYIGEGTDAGGAWYLCYDQKALPAGMRALNVSRDWSKSLCRTCDGIAYDGWNQITKYMQVSPFCIGVADDFADDPQMFDSGALAYTNTQNYGMNCEVSVGCDLTDFIIQQRAIFAHVVQMQVAANVLRTIAMNPEVRVNRNQANVGRMDVLYELDGNPQGRAAGIVHELQQAYRALSLDVRGLDRICLQCQNNGVSYSHV